MFRYSNHLSYQRNKFSIEQGLQSVLRKHQSKYSDRIDPIGVTSHFELSGLQALKGKTKRHFRFRYFFIIALFQEYNLLTNSLNEIKRTIAKYLVLIFSGVQTQAANHNSLEIRQAQTFFGVVTLFFIGHTLRIFLNLHEITLLHGDEENTDGCKLRLWNQVHTRIYV